MEKMQDEQGWTYNIFYKDWDDLGVSEFTERQAKSLVSKHAEKIRYRIHNDFKLTVHVKQYQKEGRQRKYSIHLKVDYPGGAVAVERAHDWDFRRALHKAFNDLDVVLEKKYKEREYSEDTPRKKAGSQAFLANLYKL